MPSFFPDSRLLFFPLTPSVFPTHASLFPDSRLPFSRLTPPFFLTHAAFSRLTLSLFPDSRLFFLTHAFSFSRLTPQPPRPPLLRRSTKTGQYQQKSKKSQIDFAAFEKVSLCPGVAWVPLGFRLGVVLWSSGPLSGQVGPMAWSL